MRYTTMLLTVAAAALLRGPSATEAASEPTTNGTELASIAGALPDSSSPLSRLRLEWSATCASKYLFQGLDYSEGRPVLQAQTTCGLRRFSLGAWSNLNLARWELDELDVTLQMDWEEGPLSGALGYAYLRYPHRADWEPSHEAFTDLALDVVLQPSMSVHWDVDEGQGGYWTLAMSHEVSASETALGLEAKLYIHEHYYGLTGIPALETGVSVTRGWGGFSFQPSLARVWTWENQDFRGEEAVSPSWLAIVVVSPR